MNDEKKIVSPFAEKDPSELERHYKKDLKSKNKKIRFDALLNLGSLYLEQKNYDSAEEYLNQALNPEYSNRNKSKLSVLYKTLGKLGILQYKLDSAENYFKKALEFTPENNKSSISLIYHNLGDISTKMTRMNEGLAYYELSLEIRKRYKLWKGATETLNKIGGNYFYQGDYAKALEYFNESLRIRRERKEKKELIASCLNNICLAYYHKSYYNKALDYALETLKIYKESENPENLGMIYNNLGLIYFEMSLFSEALDCQFRALGYKQLASSKPAIANTLNNIAIIFTRLFNLDKALEYSEKALELRKAVNDIRGIANSYNEIGRIYDKMNKFDKALSYLTEAVKMRREMKFPSGLIISLENIGMIYLKQGNYSEAEKYLFEAKSISEEIDEKKSIAGINRNIASMYMMLEKYNEALVYIKRSYSIAKELDLKDKLRDSYKVFSEIYGKKNNYKKALGYYILYSKANEEIINLQKQNEINSITVKYENFKKDKENEINRLKNVELTNANKDLKKSKSELQKSNSSKDKFFNIIAHDLKNPFSILYTTSELLSVYYDELGDKRRKEYINTINISTKHLLRLIENLLEWSRTQSGMRQFVPAQFDMSESIEQCIDLIKPSAETKKISLSFSAEPGVKVHADKNMIKTVIRNFITNAVKFTQTGGKIQIKAYKTEEMFYFSVTDNGTGIRKKDLSKLFVIDKHFVTNGTANEKGTGIGLLLCKEFIEKHKGRIIVESRYRKGSTFGFEIPQK
jgi:signal transduction histidine kinase/Tfp pilus assembly protein PilF